MLNRATASFPKSPFHNASKKSHSFTPTLFSPEKLKRFRNYQAKIRSSSAHSDRCLAEFNALIKFQKVLCFLNPTKFTAARATWKKCLPPLSHPNRGSHVLVTVLCTGGVQDEVIVNHLGPAFRSRGYNLSMYSLSTMPIADLAALIRRCSKWPQNALIIQQAARHFMKYHNGQIPKSIFQIICLYGIGPKMASLLIEAAHGLITAIPADRHVLRCMHILNWVDVPNDNDSFCTECALQAMEWLPRKDWIAVNDIFGAFSQLLSTKKQLLRDEVLQIASTSSCPLIRNIIPLIASVTK